MAILGVGLVLLYTFVAATAVFVTTIARQQGESNTIRLGGG